jgi:CBS domain-containing protein
MPDTVRSQGSYPLTLRAETAADLMTTEVLSIRDEATVREAVAFLIDKGISGAPVIDDAGRPVGVLSKTDILIYDREKVEHLPAGHGAGEDYDPGTPLPERRWNDFQIEKVDATTVRDVMTPAVFTVPAEARAPLVVEELLALNVHRLFVVDADGILVGVISTLDVLRHLTFQQREQS